MRSRPPSVASYRGLPLPRSVRNLLSHPGGFLTAVFGLVFVLAVKVLLVRSRPVDREVSDK